VAKAPHFRLVWEKNTKTLISFVPSTFRLAWEKNRNPTFLPLELLVTCPCVFHLAIHEEVLWLCRMSSFFFYKILFVFFFQKKRGCDTWKKFLIVLHSIILCIDFFYTFCCFNKSKQFVHQKNLILLQFIFSLWSIISLFAISNGQTIFHAKINILFYYVFMLFIFVSKIYVKHHFELWHRRASQCIVQQ